MQRRSFIQLVGLNSLVAASAACASRGEPAVSNVSPGAPAPPLGAPGTRSASIRLSSNENSHGPGPKVLSAMSDGFGSVNRYSFGRAGQLADALAASLGVSPDNLALGCGSTQVLDAVVSASVAPDRALVTAVPTFELAAARAQRLGAPVIEIRVDDALRLDLQQMAERATGAGLVYVCNPNNPTGTLHDSAVIADFAAAVLRRAPRATVLIDEAYDEYIERPEHTSAIALALENPQVVVARTFSKIYGMAGLRVGYAVGRPEALRPLTAYLDGFSLSCLSASAALTALADSGRVTEQRQLNHAARAFTADVFRAAGYAPVSSEANFLMVDVRRDIRVFQSGCRRRGVEIARPFPPLLTHARVSIGTMAEMEQAAAVFRDVLEEPPPATAQLPPVTPYLPRRDGSWAC